MRRFRSLVPLIALSGLLAAVNTAPSAAAAGRAADTAPSAPPATLAQLRAEVTATADRLDAATLRWEKGQRAFAALVQRKAATEQDLAGQLAAVAAARRRVGQLAVGLFLQPVSPTTTLFLRGDVDGFARVAYLERSLGPVSRDARAELRSLSQQAARSGALLEAQQQQTSAAAGMQRELDDELAALQDDAVRSGARLVAAQEALRQAALRRAALQRAALLRAAGSGVTSFTPPTGYDTGVPCSADAPADAINGFLPVSSLCPLASAPGHRLIREAARAFDALSAAYVRDNGSPLCVTDSYRDYAGQVDVFRRKPSLAATPGRSQHGWGRALDLCGGIQVFGSPAHQWMQANAPLFGFIHPAWAEPGGSRPEAWHWEYHGMQLTG